MIIGHYYSNMDIGHWTIVITTNENNHCIIESFSLFQNNVIMSKSNNERLKDI